MSFGHLNFWDMENMNNNQWPGPQWKIHYLHGQSTVPVASGTSFP